MQFHEYLTAYSVARRLGLPKHTDPNTFYINAAETAASKGGVFEATQFEAERRWTNLRRPYYNVYPSIIPALLRLKLDFDSGDIECPLKAILVRLPTTSNPLSFKFENQEWFVRTMLMVRSIVREERGISIWIDIGELMYGSPVYTFRNIQCVRGKTLEDSLDNLPEHESTQVGVVLPNDTVESCVRLCCTLCLLENDPDVVEPDVFAEDREKYEKSRDQKYVDKAIRRGRVGWNIGRNINIETVPHVRGPSPAALYWTGRGRTIPKIRFRRGCIVHRRKIEDIPTGYLDDEKPMT